MKLLKKATIYHFNSKFFEEINLIYLKKKDISFLQWLNERELVQNIIKLIDVNHDRDTHDNAARLVIEILRVSREVSESAQIHERCEDPILNTLESPETVELVLRIIFGRNSVSCLLDFISKFLGKIF